MYGHDCKGNTEDILVVLVTGVPTSIIGKNSKRNNWWVGERVVIKTPELQPKLFFPHNDVNLIVS